MREKKKKKEANLSLTNFKRTFFASGQNKLTYTEASYESETASSTPSGNWTVPVQEAARSKRFKESLNSGGRMEFSIPTSFIPFLKEKDYLLEFEEVHKLETFSSVLNFKQL